MSLCGLAVRTLESHSAEDELHGIQVSADGPKMMQRFRLVRQGMGAQGFLGEIDEVVKALEAICEHRVIGAGDATVLAQLGRLLGWWLSQSTGGTNILQGRGRSAYVHKVTDKTR